MKVAFYTVGCKLNQFETVAMSERVREAGFEVVPYHGEADVYVVNTCSVTAKTDHRCRQHIRRAQKNNPESMVVAVGCYAQRDPQALSDLPGVALVLDNQEKLSLRDYLEKLPDNGSVEVSKPSRNIGPSNDFPSIDSFGDHTRAFVKIQDGCDSRCTYCVVWQLRGPNRSEDPGRIVDQVVKLARAGYREVVLTGVHLGTWGLDQNPTSSLAELLKRLDFAEGGANIRLSSIEPNEFDEDLIETLAASRRIRNHLHIPLQSGSDRVLARMGRHYSAGDFRRLIGDIAGKMPEAGIGADVIVGFPGETEEDFEATCLLVEELPLAYLHVFNFSRRPGTEAAAMKDQVGAEIRKERSRRLRDMGLRKAQEFRRRFLGREMECLMENRRDKTTGLLKGITGNYVKVLADGPDSLFNTYAGVIIEKVEGNCVYGRLAGETPP
jgi:threonylcarbamoyladenosine tRNA methylthiotransferase MtaB